MEKLGTDIYGHDVYKIKIMEKPIDGQANQAVIRVLAEYFKVPARKITIISGHVSREKLIEIL